MVFPTSLTSFPRHLFFWNTGHSFHFLIHFYFLISSFFYLHLTRLDLSFFFFLSHCESSVYLLAFNSLHEFLFYEKILANGLKTHITPQHPVSPDKELQSSGTHWVQDHHLSLLSTCPSQFHVVLSWWVDDEQFFSSHHLQHTFNSINYLHFCIFWLESCWNYSVYRVAQTFDSAYHPLCIFSPIFFSWDREIKTVQKGWHTMDLSWEKYVVLPSIPSMIICNIRSFYFWSISSIELMFLIELPVW